jgi:hypothetical protein
VKLKAVSENAGTARKENNDPADHCESTAAQQRKFSSDRHTIQEPIESDDFPKYRNIKGDMRDPNKIILFPNFLSTQFPLLSDSLPF